MFLSARLNGFTPFRAAPQETEGLPVDGSFRLVSSLLLLGTALWYQSVFTELKKKMKNYDTEGSEALINDRFS